MGKSSKDWGGMAVILGPFPHQGGKDNGLSVGSQLFLH